MSQQPNSLSASKEARLQLTLQAIQRDATLSQRRAAAIYNVPQRSISNRLAGTPYRRDCTPNSMNLLKTEEDMIVQHTLDLDARGFAPRYDTIKDMANSLLAERYRNPVGQNWAANFVKRRPKLKVKFNRKYDYQRALCEDPEII
jgi:hypothetical protein